MDTLTNDTWTKCMKFKLFQREKYQAVKVSPGGSLPSPLAPRRRIRCCTVVPYTAPYSGAIYGASYSGAVQCAIYGAAQWRRTVCHIRCSTVAPYSGAIYGTIQCAIYGAVQCTIQCAVYEGSKRHVILGFRVPTTCDEKKFDDIIE